MKPELLAPAGNWEALTAAVLNGADAVYLGAKSLNARQGAGNFDRDELKRAGEFLHERGKKLYVTVNTIVKQSELSELYDIAEQLYNCRADAAIVQDFGVCDVLSNMLPGFKLHASTQMAINNSYGAKWLKEKGFDRAVLAREMSLEEIKRCAETGIETEVFCHGALCVSCSGLCLFSSIVGGRSGNRGQCAQPCRLNYELEGAARKKGCLLSPKDLNAAPIIGELCDIGVSSLKIEGRLKRPEYVAIVTQIYRRLLDGEAYTAELDEELKQIFNRGGFTKGYAVKIRDGEFISYSRPSHWGVKVAEASAKQISLEKDISSGDALVIRNDKGDEVPIKLSGSAGQRLANSAKTTGTVYRLVSQVQMDAAAKSCLSEKPSVELNAKIKLRTGEPAELTLSNGEVTVSAKGEVCEKALSVGTDLNRVREQLKKTGGTPYLINEIETEVDKDVYVPISAINKLRREALTELATERIKKFEPRIGFKEYKSETKAQVHASEKPLITVQSGDINSLKSLLDRGADGAVFEPCDVRYEKLKTLDISGMFLYLPPVLSDKSLEELNRFALESDGIKGVYITNASQLAMKWTGEIRYDFPLNIANLNAIKYLNVEESVYTASVELTARESKALGGNEELIVYGRLPLMRLRHCPLNAARGGGEHSACRACDGCREGQRLNDCRLKDRMNAEFPLKRLATDEGCVINVLNSVPMNLSSRMNELDFGRSWRLIFTDEDERTRREILNDFLQIRKNGQAITPRERFTTGHYFRKT